MLRYLIGFVVTIGLIILLIVLIFSGGGDAPSKKVPTTGKALDSYATTDAEVRVTIDGPINAAQNHRQIQITVDRHNAVMDVKKGYDGASLNKQSYDNTAASYSAFLHGLTMLNFTKGVAGGSTKQSEAGHCPTGRRYVFELIENGKSIQRYWATSCNGPHTYLGDVQTTIFLFQQQIPDYQALSVPANF
jgi:hypothetical protein